MKLSLVLAALGAFLSNSTPVAAEIAPEVSLKSQLTFAITITLDGETHEASVNEGESFDQAAFRFVNKFEGLSAEEARIDIANAVAKGMSAHYNNLVQAAPVDRIISSLDVLLGSRQMVLTRTDKQTAEQAALVFVNRNGLNKNIDVDRYLRMFTRQLNILAGEGSKPLLVDSGIQAFFPIDLSLSEGPAEAISKYNFYIVQGESVEESVTGFMARMGLDVSDDSIRSELTYAARRALSNAEDARQLKSGQGSNGQQPDQTDAGNGRVGDAGSRSETGLSGPGITGSGSDNNGGQSAQEQERNVVNLPVNVDGVEYTLQAVVGDDPYISAVQFFDAVATVPQHAGLLSMEADNKRQFLSTIAQELAKLMNPALSAPVEDAAASTATATGTAVSGVFEVAPFASRIPLIIGKNGADVEIDAGTHLATLASAVCKEERNRYLQERQALLQKIEADIKKDNGIPSSVTSTSASFEESDDALSLVFASPDGIATPVCSQLILDIFQKWYTAEAAEKVAL